MRETTSREFTEWNEYFASELEIRRREDYYLAQIACEVRKANAKHPGQIKLEQFLLKFTKGGSGGTRRPLTEDELARRTAASKGRWTALVRAHTPSKGT